MPRQSFVRRGMVELICLVALLTACLPGGFSQPAKPSPTPEPTQITLPLTTVTPAPALPLPKTFNQSPALKKLADQGGLPSLQDRLPVKPKVVRTVEQTGVYGGRWQMVIRPAADQEQFIRTVAYEPLVRWTSDWSGVEPNLVERYGVNADATDYTFYLRKGIRWSDGAPFTTEDIRFWYDNVLLNKALMPSIPYWLRSGEAVAKFSFVSDVEFKVHFAATNILFLQRLATPEALMITAFPAHYAKKYHADYAAEAEIKDLLQQGGYQSWEEMFIKRVGVNSLDGGNFIDPGRPRLSAWVLKTPYLPGLPTVEWERNPYYWKVDPEGNQLPYIDTVVFNTVSGVDETINRLASGVIDMQEVSAVSSDMWDGLKSQLQGNLYRFYKLEDTSNNVMIIQFNLTHPDAQMQQVFQNLHFRMGLSYAIDRQEIIDMIYKGKGKPWQAAPREDSPLYDKEMAAQYTQYSLDDANKYLDLAGYKKDSLGRRIGPNGRPISFTVQVLDSEPDQIAMLNFIARDWALVGIEMKPAIQSLPIYLANIQSNQHDAAASRGGTSAFTDVMLNPSNYMPFGEDSYWGMGWANYYNKVEGFGTFLPNSATYSQMRQYDRVVSSRSAADQARYLNSVVQFARSSFWTIGIALGPERFGVVKEKFRNVPERMPSSWSYPSPAPTNPEQYFIQ